MPPEERTAAPRTAVSSSAGPTPRPLRAWAGAAGCVGAGAAAHVGVAAGRAVPSGGANIGAGLAGGANDGAGAQTGGNAGCVSSVEAAVGAGGQLPGVGG